MVGTTATINFAAGHYQTFTFGDSSVTLAFTDNWPITGQAGVVTVQMTVTNVVYTLRLPNTVGFGASATSLLGIQGLNGQVITFAQPGTYTFKFTTSDGGSTIFIEDLTRPRSYFTNNVTMLGNLSVSGTTINSSSDSVVSAGACNLATATSYFTTAGTSTLAAGTAGQTKVLTQTFAGSMVVTVASYGWATGAGTITLASKGSGCTLQFTNGAWYCIGNNGATFA